MSPELSQRILDSFEEQIKEHFKQDFYKNGLTTNSAEKAEEISDRLLKVSAQMFPNWAEIITEAVSLTTVPEEKQFLIVEIDSENSQFNDMFSDDLNKTKETSAKPKFIEQYEQYYWDCLNCQLIPGSIVAYFCSLIPGLLFWNDLVHRFEKNPLFAKVLPLVAIWSSGNQLDKIKAIIDRMDKQMTPEVENKLKQIFEKCLNYEKQLYEFLYSGQEIDG